MKIKDFNRASEIIEEMKELSNFLEYSKTINMYEEVSLSYTSGMSNRASHQELSLNYETTEYIIKYLTKKCSERYKSIKKELEEL